ncbi:MAG: trypsin-like peptidase domain-containing protein, partial [Paracoccaceae bacterium]
NHHVVASADDMTVVLPDRREFQGKVILADEASDSAVVQLEDAADLPTLTLRDSDTLEVGDLVLAIGNPFGVGQTVTSGIISGLARTGGNRGRGTGVFIQTDAAINPGNSGGALVDMEGRLVGVNTAILSRSGGSNGIGFAVPAKLVARVIDEALAGGSQLARPWLGIDAVPVDGELAAALGLPTPKGVLIEAIHPDSPFKTGGVGRGDVLVSLDDEQVNTVQELEFHATSKALGQSASVGYLRDGAEGLASIKLTSAPETPARDARQLGAGAGLPGLTMVNVNPAVIDELGLSVQADGVLITRVRGAARRVGLRRGDFLRKVDGVSVGSTEDASEKLDGTDGDTVLEIERKGRLGKIRYRR